MEILLENKDIALYKEHLHQTLLIKHDFKDGHTEWKKYICDNDDRMERVLRQIYAKDYFVHMNLSIYDSQWKKHGKLQHWLLSDAYDLPLGLLRQTRVYFLNKENNNDIRLSNLYSTLVKTTETPSAKVYRNKDQLFVLLKSHNEVTRFDYSSNLEQLLTSGFLHNFSLGGKNNDRLICYVADTGKRLYLAHIIMARSCYGDLPTDKDMFLAIMKRFNEEYTQNDFEVEHLNANTYDNRMANLILMPSKMNNTKGGLMRQIKFPYFCWVERYDNTSVTMQAGYCTSLEKPVYLVEDVFTIKEFIDELRDFVNCIKLEKEKEKRWNE